MGYAGGDYGDLELEKLRKRKNALGEVRGLDRIPESERLSVKITVAEYFKHGTRDAEVDAIIPLVDRKAADDDLGLGGRKSRVYYTFRFLPRTNDVDVQLIGEEKPGEHGVGGSVDPTEFDLARVRGYGDHSASPAALKAWIAKRFPALRGVDGKTVEELRKAASEAMARRAGASDWFSENYAIVVLDEDAARDWLVAKHAYKPKQLPGLKAFEPSDLNVFEFALEEMSDAVLAVLKDTRLVRQTVELSAAGKENRKHSGLTLTMGATKTTIIYDNATVNDADLFLGSRADARPESIGTYSHEMGHLVGLHEGTQAAFNKFVATKKITPSTWYAAGKLETTVAKKKKAREGEFFPEAFALFNDDPEWMRTNEPDLFEWFTTLSETGAPPAD